MAQDMKFSENGIKHLIAEEGFETKSYLDIAGHPTIGIGHKIKPGEKFGELMLLPLSKEQVLELMRKDIKPIEDLLNNYLPGKLTQNQFDALVIFIFNIGNSAFLNSTVYQDIKAGKLDSAKMPWRRWINISEYKIDPATGIKKKFLVPVVALIDRREREIKLFEEV